jgi:putative sigma-54 modulation protein
LLVTISSRHTDVTPSLKSYAQQKSSKLTRYYDRIQEIEVIFDIATETTRLEMIVNAEHRKMFIVHVAHDDAYAAVDACIDKLERQLSDYKKRFRNRKHSLLPDKHSMRSAPPLAGVKRKTSRSSTRRK